MAETVIRVAGPYTITTDGNYLYCNGVATACDVGPAGSDVVLVVDTKCNGANGKRDRVALTAEHRAIYHRACAEAAAAAASLPANQHRRLLATLADALAAQAEDREDAVEAAVQTGIMRPIKDRTAEIAAARAALVAFEAANPGIAAEALAADEARREDNIRAALNA